MLNRAAILLVAGVFATDCPIKRNYARLFDNKLAPLLESLDETVTKSAIDALNTLTDDIKSCDWSELEKSELFFAWFVNAVPQYKGVVNEVTSTLEKGESKDYVETAARVVTAFKAILAGTEKAFKAALEKKAEDNPELNPYVDAVSEEFKVIKEAIEKLEAAVAKKKGMSKTSKLLLWILPAAAAVAAGAGFLLL